MNTKFCSLAIAAAALFVSTASAQGLLLQVDRGTGAMTLTGSAPESVNLGGYRIGSNNGSINSDNFNGLRDEVADWVLAGTSGANGVQELLSNALASTPVNDGVSYGLGNVYDPVQAMQNAGFGVEIEETDLSLLYYDTQIKTTLGGTIAYTGERRFNNIGITVDLADGTAIIENESPFDQTIKGYLIKSGTEGTLTTDLGAFNGVRDEAEGSSFQSPTVLDGSNLGELDPTGAGISLNAGAAYSLGSIGASTTDLSFTYILAGSDQASRVGFIKYLNVGANGDFNSDGKVDGADFLAWQRGESPSPLSTSDLENWQSNYGQGGGAAVAAAGVVPEPTTALLAALMLVGAGVSRHAASRVRGI